MVNAKPDAVLCLACGETPQPVMDRLVKARNEGRADFSRIRLLGLDEWIGVGRQAMGSCAQMLYDDFFTPMALRQDQISIFNGLSENLNDEIKKANRIVEELGIDFTLLGIGMNGHIGLNEPGFNPALNASIVSLSDITKIVMTKYFGGKSGLSEGITLGFAQLLNARKIVLMATGERKAKIVKQIIDSSPNNQLPASLLKISAHQTEFYLDAAAAKKL